MPVRTFACNQCGSVDIDTSVDNNQELCFACQDNSGEWHGLFEREQFDPDTHTDVDNEATQWDESPDGVPSFS